MAIKGIRNAKKVTNETILGVASDWMNSLRWNIQVGTMVFTITHQNGTFYVYNSDGDLLRKFKTASNLEVELDDIKRHNWTKDLVCSDCNVGMFDVENTNDECNPPNKKKKRKKKKDFIKDKNDVKDKALIDDIKALLGG